MFRINFIFVSLFFYFFVQLYLPSTAIYSITNYYEETNCIGNILQISYVLTAPNCESEDSGYFYQTCNSTNNIIYSCTDSNCTNCIVNSTSSFSCSNSEGSSSYTFCADSIPSYSLISSYPNYGMSHYYSGDSCTNESAIYNSYFFFINTCSLWDGKYNKLFKIFFTFFKKINKKKKKKITYYLLLLLIIRRIF